MFLSPYIVSYIASGTINAGQRVMFAGGDALTVVVAGIADVEIGTAILFGGKSIYYDGDAIGVLPINAGGTRTCVANGAINAGDIVRRAALGTVDVAGAGDNFGYACEAAVANGDLMEVLTVPGLLVTPSPASVTTAMLSPGVAGEIFGNTLAVANNAPPVGLISGQVTDAQGNPVAGRFHVDLYTSATAYGAPAAEGAAAAAAGTTILASPVANAKLSLLTAADGSFGVNITTVGGATIFAQAVVVGKVSTATAIITAD